MNTLVNGSLAKDTHNRIFPDEYLIQGTLDSCQMDGSIFIPGEVPSKKNSKRIIYRNNKPLIIDSHFTTYYEKHTAIFYNLMKKNWLKMVNGKELPYSVKFTFGRRTLQRFDYLNIGQVVQDMMVSAGWLEDDNSNFIVPSFGKAYKSELFGVWIEVL
jgi:hypothetical protein